MTAYEILLVNCWLIPKYKIQLKTFPFPAPATALSEVVVILDFQTVVEVKTMSKVKWPEVLHFN